MSRLILVSNRLPVTVVPGPQGAHVEPSAGGLATALRELQTRSRGVWVGWPGPTDGIEKDDLARIDRALGESGCVPVHLSAEEVERYYETYSNGVLWPVLHYVTGVLPLRLEGWRDYEVVNERFADMVAAQYRSGDVIWVHDYQLMLVPAMLRARLPGARIGFFLHTPFPSSEVFATLPCREELLSGLLGADVIGFHTAPYRGHFESAIQRILGLRPGSGEVHLPTRRIVRLGVLPIGADATAFAAAGNRSEVAAASSALRGDASSRLLVGVDRLDYTKGIPRRLLAFEELLVSHPEWRERVRLVQVAVPTRTGVDAYRKLGLEVDRIVRRVNATFGTERWTPVEYVHRAVSDVELLALYRAADVMLVTPVRDGMNLVAKEFVATRVDEQGVLVLSEFAGAAVELGQAVLVNPYDIASSAEAFHRALTMPHAEASARMKAMRKSVFAGNIHRWGEIFLQSLGFPSAPQGGMTSRTALRVKVAC
jgi:trehalose 6-phosphate synthase/phosphatase